MMMMVIVLQMIVIPIAVVDLAVNLVRSFRSFGISLLLTSRCFVLPVPGFHSDQVHFVSLAVTGPIVDVDPSKGVELDHLSRLGSILLPFQLRLSYRSSQ